MNLYHFYYDRFPLMSENLRKIYSQKDRYYHNMEHIKYMLDVVTKTANNGNRAILSYLIAWYHDAVYSGKYNDEEKSAELAIEELGPYLDSRDVNLIADGILATKHQLRSRSFCEEISMVMDADLYILGESPQVYAKYARNIRKEYSNLTDSLYIHGRSKFLNKMLKRDSYYSFNWDRDLLAKKNMEMELDSLNKGILL